MFASRTAAVLGTWIVLGAAASATAQDRSRLIGTWQADAEKSAAAVEDAQLAEQIRALARAGVKLRIVVSNDKTMTAYIDRPGAEQEKRTGKWTLAKSRNKEATLRVVDDKTRQTHEVRVIFLKDNVVRVVKQGQPLTLVFTKS